MFSIAHNVYSLCAKQSEQRFTAVVLGIDNAGKTTLISTINGEITDPESGTSTFGRTNTLVKNGKTTINFVDLGGGKNMRRYWQDVFSEVHAWIYVVDSACPERFEETRQMLSESSQHDLLANKPLLMFLNKCDLPEALPEDQVAKALMLDQLNVASYQLQRCTALRTTKSEEMDQRISDGLAWLHTAVAKDYSSLDARVERDIVLQKEKEAALKAQKKAERERKKREREEREAREAAEAEAMAEKEASLEKVEEVQMKQLGGPQSADVESAAVSASDVPATPPKAAVVENSTATPGEPLPGTSEPAKAAAPGELPALKGLPARLEPIQASPGFTDAQAMPPSPLSTNAWRNPVSGVIQDSPLGPSAPITDHPNIPPGSPIA